MLITRECDYAVRIIRELADDSRKTVKDICDKEYIPLPFAYKILKKLEKSHLVRSYRGAKGGYALGKSADQITLLDILSAVEDELFLNECLSAGHECPRNTKDAPCKVHKELCGLQRSLFDALKDKTMAEILESKDQI